jgi:signal transduction histidine kinase
VRLDESRTRDDGGAGLGLAIVSKVVESSGGTVVVGEAPGGGARLTVSLPAVAPGT